MKKIFILLLLVAIFSSCKKENSTPKLYTGPLYIKVNGAVPTLKATGYDPYYWYEGLYPAKEIVKRAATIQAEKPNGGLLNFSITDSFRDTVKVRIMVPSELVVTPDLVITEFCYCKNMLILDSNKDTIAYLRNSDLKLFRDFMEVRMKEKDFRTLDLLFESTMYFNYINGRQYKEMKMYGDDKY